MTPLRVRPRDTLFHVSIVSLMSAYALLIVAMLVAMAWRSNLASIASIFEDVAIRRAMLLSLISSTLSMIIALWIAVPTAYLLSRYNFFAKRLIDAILDVPIALPPLVIGLALLILFRTAPGRLFESQIFGVSYEIPAIVLAQVVVATAFAIRTMRATFDQIDPRHEDVARTLGMSRARAFRTVTIPEARPGIVAAGTIAWARSLGEFGPILVFAGATRMKTEVLPTTIYLEMTTGELGRAMGVAILMVALAIAALVLARICGAPDTSR